MRKSVLFIAVLWLLNACGFGVGAPDADVKEQAQEFAEAYFNYDFITACRFATSESEKWLRYAASNVTQEDVDLINANSERASAEVTACHRQNDSIAHVMVMVHHAMLKDSIGHPVYVADEIEFALTLVRRDGNYLVRMEGLPRNEKQSRGLASGE